MSDDLEGFTMSRPANPDRPFQGMTALVVEDSRFASEAIRLLCLRSGARIRRADSLAAAHRHLSVYRPSIVIVDMGLPDGCGDELLAELDQTAPRVPVLLGISGDATRAAAALAAGADGFLVKPIESLAVFQQEVLKALPQGQTTLKPRVVPSDMIEPDRLSLQDDLSHMAEVIDATPKGETLDYIAQFLEGVARSAHDSALEEAAAGLATARAMGRGTGTDLARVAGILQDRLEKGPVL